MMERARSLPDVFEVVKLAASQYLGRTRGGLMLALPDLGNYPNGWFRAFYVAASDAIVMNKVPPVRLNGTQPHLYKDYRFPLLLHEELHSPRFLGETRC